ncbi:hypothetical protein PIB30_108829, partial [Stylosanthes scabra]|nr:hypothetical protein [Stylosanthes scabra]
MAEVRGNDPGEKVREVEGAQMPHELNPLYSWATRDVLGSPSTLTEDYLKSLKESGVICGGGEEEEHYLPKVVLGNPEHAREEILNMAGGKKSLALLRQAMQQNPQGPIILDPTSGQASSSNLE